MLKATMLELILYGTHLTWNGVSAYSSNLSYTLFFGGWYILESRCVFLLDASGCT